MTYQSSRTPQQSRAAEVAANEYWRGVIARQQVEPFRGVAHVGTASYDNRRGWTEADAAVYAATMSAVRARAVMLADGAPLRGDGSGGQVPIKLPAGWPASNVAPGRYPRDSAPLSGGYFNKRIPAFDAPQARPEYVVHLPVSATSLEAAKLIACTLARDLGSIPEIDAGEVTVSEKRRDAAWHRVFCDALVMLDGGERRQCPQIHGHAGDHGPLGGG